MRKFSGRALTLAITGTSHSAEIGFRLEGLPTEIAIDDRRLALFMARRAPGGSGVSARRESDGVKIFREGKGICGIIKNENARPLDYGAGEIPRPGHADFPQWIEAGRILSGGGDNSGRMTAAFCAAGYACIEFLRVRGIEIGARVETIGGKRRGFKAAIKAARAKGDSLGGTIICEVKGLRPGLGGAIFEGLESSIAPLIFAIPGVRGIEFGAGFKSAEMLGSEFNDSFVVKEGEISTKTNHHGGILGGRATGMPLVFRVAMRPTPTIAKTQRSVNLTTMKAAKIAMNVDRHDPAFVVRSSPIVEAAAAIAIADQIIDRERRGLRICQVLSADTIEGMVAEYAVERYFVDMVELRVDRLKPNEREKVETLRSRVIVPIILTFRRKAEGGDFDGSEKERREFFCRHLVSGCGFEYVDFEADFATSKLVTLAHSAGVKVIHSIHCDAEKLENELCKLSEGGNYAAGDAVKLVVRPNCVQDAMNLLTRDFPFPRVWSIFASGRTGFFTRILAKLNRSEVIYATTGELSAMGMISPHELVRDYRLRTLSTASKVFAVIGNPLDYTESPMINNAAYLNEDRDAVMVPIPCRDFSDVDCVCQSSIFSGFAVTNPYKRYFAKRIDNANGCKNSVNTILKQQDGRLYGYSTDGEGFMQALVEFISDKLKNKKISILGDGGASKAIQAEFDSHGIKYEVFHRRPIGSGYDLIINATPVDPIAEYSFSGLEYVFDLGYRREGLPPLAKRAKAAGCKVMDGRLMLKFQAELQRGILLGGEAR